MAADAPRLTQESFAAEVAKLAGPGFDANTPVALAVSGGPDSLAMLWLARGLGAQVHVLSVDHGLRAEAATECAMVAALAAEIGLPHKTLRLALEPGGNVQAVARQGRYAAMGEYCRTKGIGQLLTAHHRDDQAETLLMRLARGSGAGGLASVRAVSEIEGLRVLRPLLGWSRADLQAVLADSGWSAVIDPSNSDPRYDRTAARTLLASTPWLEPARLASSAGHLADAEDALAWATERAWETRVSGDAKGLIVDAEGLPGELQRRLLARAIAESGGKADGPSLARLAGRLAEGHGGTLAEIKVQALGDGRWRFTKAPPRR